MIEDILFITGWAGGALLLARGQHAEGSQQEVPGHGQLHRHRLVPRVAPRGPGVGQSAFPPGRGEHSGETVELNL